MATDRADVQARSDELPYFVRNGVEYYKPPTDVNLREDFGRSYPQYVDQIVNDPEFGDVIPMSVIRSLPERGEGFFDKYGPLLALGALGAVTAPAWAGAAAGAGTR